MTSLRRVLLVWWVPVLLMAVHNDQVFWFSFADIDKIVHERDCHHRLVRPNATSKPAWHPLKRLFGHCRRPTGAYGRVAAA